MPSRGGASIVSGAEPDGKALFMKHCSGCHGANGNGKGTMELPRPARSYLVDRPDAPGRGGKPFCAGYRKFHWEQTWSAVELSAILQRTLPDYVRDYGTGARGRWVGTIFSPRQPGADPLRPGELRDLEILRRTPSGRVADLAVTTEAGTYHVRGDRTRWVLAPPAGAGTILRSALFDLELSRDGGVLRSVTARGRGYGHGIGMCQVGALAMARAGYDFAAILKHYYPGAELVHLRTAAKQ